MAPPLACWPPVTSLQNTPPSALGRGPAFRAARREGGSRLRAPPTLGILNGAAELGAMWRFPSKANRRSCHHWESGMKLHLPMKWKIFHVSRSPCKQLLLGGSISSVLLSSHASTSGVSCRLKLPGRRDPACN